MSRMAGIAGAMSILLAGPWVSGRATRRSMSGNSAPGVQRIPEEEWTAQRLGKLLGSEDFRERYSAISHARRALRTGPRKLTRQQALGLAMKGLADNEPPVLIESARLVGDLKKEAKSATPALMKLLKDEDLWVRRDAVAAVVAVGGASDAAGELRVLFRAGDQLDVVTAALVKAGEKGRAALWEGLESKNDHVRLWAHAGMAKMNLGVKRHVQAILKQLPGAPPKLKIDACKALGMVGKPAGAAGKTLARLLEGKDRQVHFAAARAIRDVLPKDPAVVAALARQLETKEADRGTCLVTLRWMGPDAKPAVPAMVRLMEQDERLRFAVLLALRKIDPKSREALPALLRILHKSLEDRPDAHLVLAIGVYAEAAKAAVPDLVKVLSHPLAGHGGYVVEAAIWALGQVGPEARAAAGALRKFIPGPFAGTAARALKRIEAKDPATMPAADERFKGYSLKF